MRLRWHAAKVRPRAQPVRLGVPPPDRVAAGGEKVGAKTARRSKTLECKGAAPAHAGVCCVAAPSRAGVVSSAAPHPTLSGRKMERTQAGPVVCSVEERVATAGGWAAGGGGSRLSVHADCMRQHVIWRVAAACQCDAPRQSPLLHVCSWAQLRCHSSLARSCHLLCGRHPLAPS